MNRLTQKIINRLLVMTTNDNKFGKFLIGVIFNECAVGEFARNGLSTEMNDMKADFSDYVRNHLRAAEKLLKEVRDESGNNNQEVRINNRLGTELLPLNRIEKFKTVLAKKGDVGMDAIDSAGIGNDIDQDAYGNKDRRDINKNYMYNDQQNKHNRAQFRNYPEHTYVNRRLSSERNTRGIYKDHVEDLNINNNMQHQISNPNMMNIHNSGHNSIKHNLNMKHGNSGSKSKQNNRDFINRGESREYSRNNYNMPDRNEYLNNRHPKHPSNQIPITAPKMPINNVNDMDHIQPIPRSSMSRNSFRNNHVSPNRPYNTAQYKMPDMPAEYKETIRWPKRQRDYKEYIPNEPVPQRPDPMAMNENLLDEDLINIEKRNFEEFSGELPEFFENEVIRDKYIMHWQFLKDKIQFYEERLKTYSDLIQRLEDLNDRDETLSRSSNENFDENEFQPNNNGNSNNNDNVERVKHMRAPEQEVDVLPHYNRSDSGFLSRRDRGKDADISGFKRHKRM